MARAEALFTGPNLTTQSIDAAVILGRRRDGPEEAGARSLSREFHLDLTIS
jgi:hypothetical protein